MPNSQEIHQEMDYKDAIKHVVSSEPRPGAREEHREGPVARSIEQQTAKLPSDLSLWAALASIGTSLFFQLTGDERKATFVGHWAPTFLTSGLYNNLVKLHGSEGV
jgi:hypothetical protein